MGEARSLQALKAEWKGLEAPPLPRPLPPLADPAYISWRKAFVAYAERRALLRAEILAQGGLP